MKRTLRIMSIFAVALSIGPAGECAAESGAFMRGAQRAANAFNPKLSVILQGRYAHFSGAAGQREMPGVALGTGTGRGPEGFSLGESELDTSANVDDKIYGFFDVAFDQENGESSVEIEEAYLQTLALPAGFTVKGGQFLSAIGFQNGRHSHTWAFVDQPLVYEALLGGQLLDPGLQISWLAPTDLYLEVGGEAFRGDAFPAAGAARSGVGTFTVFAKASADIGESSSWKAGLSWLTSEARERESRAWDATDGTLSFSGRSELVIADLVFKWAPQGNFRQRNLVLQAEYLHGYEKGDVRLATLPAGSWNGRYRGIHDGFYLQGVYQFMPRWRVGARFDQLFSDNAVSGLPANTLSNDAASPRRVSAMVDFSNSEFSRLRMQYAHESGGLGGEDAVFVQYIISIGSHGAHAF